jgi:3-oxoacyl-[acyl-carrier-protein] synthase II
MKRVAVTGIGALSPVGNSFKESWEALLKGSTGIGPITRFNASGMSSKATGELKGFNPGDYIPLKDIKRLDPFVHYAAAAARMAVDDSELKGEEINEAAVLIGSSRGGIGSLESAVKERATAYLMAGSTVSMAASYVSKVLGAKGHVLGISNACSSGANAVGEAMRLIRHGYADVALAGGTEAPLTPLSLKGYGASGALSKKGIMRPFDRQRDGFVLAEGAAVLVLEDFNRAMGRGAKIYGEALGYGNTSDAFHMTVPDAESQARSIKAALEDAGINKEDVGYINAHATSTPIGDRTEADAITGVFGAGVPVSATKSLTGHMLGASSAFEAAVALMSLSEHFLHQTINLEEPDFSLEHITEGRAAKINVAVSNAFGFGGVNAVLVFGKAAE